MTSEIYRGMRQVKGWMPVFLQNIRNGFNDTNAASRADIGSNVIRQRLESDPQFKADYEAAHAVKRPRFGHGRF